MVSAGQRPAAERCQDCGVYFGRYFLDALESLGKTEKEYSRWKASAAKAGSCLIGPVWLIGLLGGLLGVAACAVLMLGALADFLRAPIGIKDSPEAPWALPAVVVMVGSCLLLWFADKVGDKLDKLIPNFECPVCYFHSPNRTELRTHVEHEHEWSPEAVLRWMERLEVSIFGAG
jgi:hypothetical protein